MKKIIILLLGLIILGVIWALPLYFGANLLLWAFHIPFRWTLLQSICVCIFASILRGLFFSDKGGK